MNIKFRIWDCGLKTMSYSPQFAITSDGKLFYGNADVIKEVLKEQGRA